MFQNEIRDGQSPFAFLAQQIFIPLGLVMWGAFSCEIPRQLSRLDRPVGVVIEAACILALAALPAFFLGRLVRRDAPDFATAGKWIWILPLMVTLMISGMLTGGFTARDAEELFFPIHDGEAWWAVFMATYPTIGCIAYSLGIGWQGRLSEPVRLKPDFES